MPRIIQSVDEIMAAAKHDMFFLELKSRAEDVFPNREEAEGRPAFLRQTEWFASKGLAWESAQPRGLIEGYGGIYAIWFKGPDDPLVTDYSTVFEDADGISLDPDCYQLYRIDYRSWLETPPPLYDDL